MLIQNKNNLHNSQCQANTNNPLCSVH